ncbi:MAG: histidine--tRNA ligase [Actinomycetota bacterium]
MELAPPRGTDDLLPPRADAMLGLYDAAHAAASLRGFRYVETPTFEHTELFARTSGDTSDVVTKEMYTFEDQGGRSMTLRPESTAAVVRAFLGEAHELGPTFRGYYVHTNFRHARPQAGRLREFRVFGVEVLGAPSPEADVEVIATADAYLRDRGLARQTLRLNSIGDATCRPAYREALVAHLRPHAAELDDDCRSRLEANPMRVLDCKVDAEHPAVRSAPSIADHLCAPCAEHLAGVRDGLAAAGVAWEPDPRLVRGLDYYTRTAFEFVTPSLPAGQSTVCGGGRYDGLAEALGGPATPGVGFGMGLDRVLIAMESEGVALPRPHAPRVFLFAIGEAARAAAATLVGDLRAAGVSAVSSFEDRPVKAQFRMADRAGSAYAAILGDREVASGSVTLHRLADGSEESVPRGDVAARVGGDA